MTATKVLSYNLIGCAVPNWATTNGGPENVFRTGSVPCKPSASQYHGYGVRVQWGRGARSLINRRPRGPMPPNERPDDSRTMFRQDDLLAADAGGPNISRSSNARSPSVLRAERL